MTLGYALVQADLQSDVPPKIEASGGQEQYIIDKKLELLKQSKIIYKS